MISSLAITNFKNLARIPADEGQMLPLGPLNVLIGPNGSGKSSFLQAIDFLRAFFRSSVEVYLQERGWNYRDLPNLREAAKTIRWELNADLDADEQGKGAGKYHYLIELQPRKHLGVGREWLTWAPNGSPSTDLLVRKGRSCLLRNRLTDSLEESKLVRLPASVMSTLESRERAKYPEAMRFREWVEGFRSYLIWDPKVLRNPDRGRHSEMGQSGEHLASILGHLKDRNREAFDKLVRRLRRLFPTLSDISVSGGGWGWRTIRLHEGDGRAAIFNSQQMSDGVLRLLAVTSLLYLDRIPTVITFEEPENGVHPQLIREVVQTLR